MNGQRVFLHGTFTITSVCYNDDGATLDCTISVNSGVLVAIFAKVVPHDSLGTENLTPWDDMPSNPPTQGNAAGRIVRGIPTNGRASGGLYVWCVFDGGSSFVRERFEFEIGGSGSGAEIEECGSGSGSAFGFVTTQVSHQHKESSPDAMARVYKMSVDIASMNLDAYGAGYLAAGLLCSANVYLCYDEMASTPTNFVWSGKNLADATGVWTLGVNCGRYSPQVKLMLQQIGQSSVSTPLVWESDGWSFCSSNKLVSKSDHCLRLVMPDIRIEPA